MEWMGAGAHSYSEYGKWPSRGPELPIAWGNCWATLSLEAINTVSWSSILGAERGAANLSLYKITGLAT